MTRSVSTQPSDHLGDRVAAVADGALPPAELEQVFAHVAGCPACRAAVEAERAAKRWVMALHEPEPQLELLGRLLTISPTRPVHPISRPSVRSLVALSGASATVAAVLLVGVTSASSPGVVARSGERPVDLRSTSVASAFHVPVAVAAPLPTASVPATPDADRSAVTAAASPAVTASEPVVAVADVTTTAGSQTGTSLVGRARPAAPGLPVAFAAAAGPGATPPWAGPAPTLVPGVTR
jgi:hypothetical protein